MVYVVLVVSIALLIGPIMWLRPKGGGNHFKSGSDQAYQKKSHQKKPHLKEEQDQ